MSAADNYFHELQERIKTHPGKKVFDALRAFDMSKFILDGNAFQLRQLITVLEDPKDPAQVMGMDRRQHLQWLFNDVNRHIHNFLTSITTLVDHTRNLMKEDFIKPEHWEEYQSKVRVVFALDPLAQFLQDFRNYITHYEVPHIGLDKRFGSALTDAEPGELIIDLDHLASGFNWSAPSRKFIEENKPQIRSTIKRLATSFQISEPVGSFVGRVNYVDFETYDLGSRGEDQALVPFLKDKNKFADENEARIVTLNMFHQGTLLPDGSQPIGAGLAHEIQGLYIKCSLRELIQSIVVGPNTDWNFHMLMKRLVARFGLTINVEHSKLSPFK